MTKALVYLVSLLAAAGVVAGILWLARCRHLHMRRETRGRTLMLVCEHCDYAEPAITWTLAERKRAAKLQQRMRRSKASPAEVVDIRARKVQ